MKKVFTILIISQLILFGFVAAALSNNENIEKNILTITESITISNPIIIENGRFLIIDFEESRFSLNEIGKPSIPIIIKTFNFPLGTEIVKINVDYDISEIILSKKIQPSPSPIIDSNRIEQDLIDLKYNKSVYESSDLFPSKPYVISSGAGRYNGELNLFINIRLTPQYLSIKNLLLIPKNIEITIEYKQPDISIINNEEKDMVVIAPNYLSSDLQPLIEHKNTYGVRTYLKETDEIYLEYDGRDEAEKIKYFIKDAIESMGISYVLLVGDINLVPIRKTICKGFIDCEMITDLYYSDIYDSNMSFSSWDSNNDNVFGEYWWSGSYNNAKYIDFVDLYPDIGVGRIPCKNNKELELVINKIITYETQSYGQNWFNRLILIGGDTFPWYDTYEGELTADNISLLMSEFEHIKLYTSTNTFIPDMVNKEITDGASFVGYSGHGYEYGIATYPPDGTELVHYNIFNLFGLRNGDKLPVFYLNACKTSNIDFTLQDLFDYYPENQVFDLISKLINTTIIFPCLAWLLLKDPLGGAIATIGATRNAYGGSIGNTLDSGGSRLQLDFFESYEPGVKVSQMLTNAQITYLNNVWRDYITLEEFILLGDPSLKIGGYS